MTSEGSRKFTVSLIYSHTEKRKKVKIEDPISYDMNGMAARAVQC